LGAWVVVDDNGINRRPRNLRRSLRQSGGSPLRIPPCPPSPFHIFTCGSWDLVGKIPGIFGI